MEAASSKLRARPFRLSFDITATLFEEKEAMAARFNSVRKLFTAEGGKIDNFSLVSKMLDAVEAVHGGSSTEPGSREPKIKSLMRDSVMILLPIAVNKKSAMV